MTCNTKRRVCYWIPPTIQRIECVFDKLILLFPIWFGVILCIHYVLCVCPYGIPTICILALAFPPHSDSPSISILIKSWSLLSFPNGEGVTIYTLYVVICFVPQLIIKVHSVSVWKRCFLSDLKRGIQSRFAYLLAIGGVLLRLFPSLSLSARSRSSYEVCWGFYYKILYILCCGFVLFLSGGTM